MILYTVMIYRQFSYHLVGIMFGITVEPPNNGQVVIGGFVSFRRF